MEAKNILVIGGQEFEGKPMTGDDVWAYADWLGAADIEFPSLDKAISVEMGDEEISQVIVPYFAKVAQKALRGLPKAKKEFKVILEKVFGIKEDTYKKMKINDFLKAIQIILALEGTMDFFQLFKTMK